MNVIIPDLYITNETNWDTNELRRLIKLTIKEKGWAYNYKDITIRTSKDGKYHGQAGINGNRILMKVPMPVSTKKYIVVKNLDMSFRSIEEHPSAYRYAKKENRFRAAYCCIFDSKKFTQIFIHEWQHNQGEEHKDQAPWWKISVPWTNGFIVHPKRTKPKPKRDIVLERSNHAKDMFAQHTAELKTLETRIKAKQKLIKKWRGKVKYYKQALAEREVN